ncbi:MAG: glycosyltransferase family 9 protein [Melioribacteraceae bacterium]|nr:glycosyltransferase family 9 protein [Melioribacteraceae bacterium]MCF8355798.1 glycosyltransferase family 9 protein [Melioribacteraceae bacterium]MCF8392812.1 glycosyltransferase family 9 protein [Melioribacteraceae bacterium]MCF8418702.1 glycosyltransferase family 9 protein [Melioribacteraceae bacterium]
MKEPKNILLVRTDRIGDVVLTLPLAAIIKKHFPESRITFLIRSYTKELVSGNPNVDDIILLREENSKLPIKKNIDLIKSHQFDVSITANPSFDVALILFFSGIKKRIGTGYRWYSFLFNRKFFEHRKHGTKHELDHNMNLLRLIGIEEGLSFENVPFNIHVDVKNIRKIEKLLNELNIDSSKSIIIFHPGSGGSSIDLPFLHQKELIELLARELNVNIIVTGSENEKQIGDKLMVSDKIKNMSGKLNLGELIALISKSDLLIANSTGPIHIAAALNKYVIGFYPKIASCSVTRWGPYTSKREIFTPTLECSNCSRKQCEELNCMASINIQNVFNSIKSIIDKITYKR